MRLADALPIDDDKERLLPTDLYHDISLEEPIGRKRANTILYDCDNPNIPSPAWYANWRDATNIQSKKYSSWPSLRFILCSLSFSVVFIIGVITVRDLIHSKGKNRNDFQISTIAQLRDSPPSVRHKWVLQESFSETLNRTILTTNGEMPGPMLEGLINARLRINVHNKLPFPVAIHWHGISQRGTNGQDGVPAITQDPILPGHRFEYHFVLDQAGTFWWHAHADTSRLDGLYGALIVHPSVRETAISLIEPANMTDYVLLVSDWYDAASRTYRTRYLSQSNIDLQEPLPGRIMINGVADLGRLSTSFKVPRDERAARFTRLRIINVGAFAEVRVAAPKKAGTFTAIEADATLIMPVQISSLNIAVGQRYSLILDNDDYASDEEVLVDLELDLQSHLGGISAPVPGSHRAISHHSHHHRDVLGAIVPATPNATDVVPESIHLHDGMLHPPTISRPRNSTVHSGIFELPLFRLDLGMQRRNEITKSTINNTTYVPQNHPITQEYTHSTLDNVTALSHKYSPDILTLSIAQGEEVLLLFTGQEGGNHPIHVHGHRMTVLATESFFFNPITQQRINRAFNPASISSVLYSARQGTALERTIERDTINVRDGGWSLVSLRAAGKGVWFMHCHSAWHEQSGMAMVLEVR